MVDWSEKRRGQWHGLNVQELLAVEREVLGITIEKSLIIHQQAATTVFAARWSGKGDVLG